MALATMQQQPLKAMGNGESMHVPSPTVLGRLSLPKFLATTLPPRGTDGWIEWLAARCRTTVAETEASSIV